MAIDRILIQARHGPARAALLDGGRLVELVFNDRPGGGGDIRLGRVSNMARHLNAAFVDVGLERDGFLPLKKGDGFGEGDRVLVQVLREAEGDKGPKLTTRVSLPGRLVVFLPGQPEVRLSRRIEGKEERARLLEIGRRLAGGDGLLLRLAALGAAEGAIAAEVERQRQVWAEIKRNEAAAVRAPLLLASPPEPVLRAVFELAGPNFRRLDVDDPSWAARLKAMSPGLDAITFLHKGPEGLFESSGVEAQIESALSPLVPLPGGGRLMIEPTAALIAIDVDSGSAGGDSREAAALEVNLEAASQLARQVRMRDLAGLVIVDFLRLRKKPDRERLLTHLRLETASDPAGIEVLGFTPSGAVEMTRKKRGEPLARILGGTEEIARRALAAAEREGLRRPDAKVVIRAAPEVVGALNGALRQWLLGVESRLGSALALEPAAVNGFEITCDQRGK